MSANILIVEDDKPLQKYLKELLLDNGYSVSLASDGVEASEHLEKVEPDLVVLDLGLPKMSGESVCREIRERFPQIRIIILTAKDSASDIVQGLQLGADDYMTKPFDVSELRARINALARRQLRNSSTPLLSVGDLTLNPSKRHVERSGSTISLRRKEFDILEYLMRNVGRVLSREMIVNHAWPVTSNTWSGSVDVHIKQLRDKVDRPFSYPLIKTSYGVGYMVDLPDGD